MKVNPYLMAQNGGLGSYERLGVASSLIGQGRNELNKQLNT